jgi:GNAT superfamily N-acetyltransferase
MKEADLQPAYSLIQDTIQASYHQVYSVEAIEFFQGYHSRRSIWDDATSGYAVVAESDDEIIGMGILLGTNVRRVFVSPKHQHRGIGKSIVQELVRMALFEKLPALDLDSSLTAREFWESLGFVVQKEGHIPVRNGKELLFFRMVKTLAAATPSSA